jgi:hypothetical protein
MRPGADGVDAAAGLSVRQVRHASGAAPACCLGVSHPRLASVMHPLAGTA